MQPPQLSEAELAELMRKARGDDGEEPPSAEAAADRMGGLGSRLCVLPCALDVTDGVLALMP